jgi:hypothetical protein
MEKIQQNFLVNVCGNRGVYVKSKWEINKNALFKIGIVFTPLKAFSVHAIYF